MTDTNTNNTEQNKANPLFSRIFAGVMNDIATAGNRQAELSVAMYGDALMFSESNIIRLFSFSGSERTERVDSYLIDMSPDFSTAYFGNERLADKFKELGKGNRPKQDAFTFETNNKKMRAARIMFLRALAGAYAIRVMKARSATLATKVGNSVIRVSVPDVDNEGDWETKTFSASSLANDGEKRLRELSGKAPKTNAKAADPRNHAANSLADSSKAMSAILSSIASSNEVNKLSEANAELEGNFANIFERLFASMFTDNGKLDRSALNDWLNEHYPNKNKGSETKAA